MTFGKALRRIRTDKGLSQREVARRIPMDYSRFSRLENDRLGFNPTRDTIEKIVRAIGASPEERGELLGAAGRLDTEVESMARLASERPAIGKLLRIAVGLTPEKIEALLNYAETELMEGSETYAEEGTSSDKRRATAARRGLRK